MILQDNFILSALRKYPDFNMTDNNFSIRAFFAIDLPNHIKEHIYKTIIQVLNKETQWSGVHWSSPNHLHITLQFVPSIQLTDINTVIDQAKRTLSQSFNLTLGALEFFPNKNKPKIISLAILKGEEELTKLSNMLGRILSQLNYPIETRPFRPHLTLGKLIHYQSKMLLENISFSPLEIRVEEMTLFESRPTKNSSIYIPIEKIHLK